MCQHTSSKEASVFRWNGSCYFLQGFSKIEYTRNKESETKVATWKAKGERLLERQIEFNIAFIALNTTNA